MFTDVDKVACNLCDAVDCSIRSLILSNSSKFLLVNKIGVYKGTANHEAGNNTFISDFTKNVYKARNEENVHLKCIYRNPLTVVLEIIFFYINITLDVIKLLTFSNFKLF